MNLNLLKQSEGFESVLAFRPSELRLNERVRCFLFLSLSAGGNARIEHNNGDTLHAGKVKSPER